MGGPPPEIRPTGDIAAWYRKLCTATSGVLYEDTYLQARPCSISLVMHNCTIKFALLTTEIRKEQRKSFAAVVHRDRRAVEEKSSFVLQLFK